MGSGPIVVATTGEHESDAALRTAWSLVGRTGADVHVLSVVEPIVPVVEFAIMTELPGDLWQDQHAAQFAAVREQLKRTLPAECEWPVSMINGEGGEAVARYAREIGARLIVSGRGRHRLAHRLVAPETVLRMLRFADTPVFAVEPDAPPLPRRVVIGTDFSHYSTYAARVALSLTAPNAMVYLAHVRPKVETYGAAALLWERSYDDALPAMFARMREELPEDPGVQIETVTLTGRPGKALIDFAASSRADLVVSGTHGFGFFNRLVLGSVATDLLRDAPCSLLCVPGSAVTHAAARRERVERLHPVSIPMAALASELAGFSRQNVGRLSELQSMATRADSKVLASGVALVGVDFDHNDGAITILFGAGGPGEHLSHSIRDIRAVDRLTDAHGADRGLAVQHKAGTTSLRFFS
jgi:nucleotide-binding universal stress UspA family protein